MYVDVKIEKISSISGLYAFNVDISFKQWVLLYRDTESSVFTETWSVERTGSVREEDIVTIRDYIKDSVDEFINDYLSVNPK